MKGSDLAQVKVTIRGYVQGVFFRAFVAKEAKALGLVGYASNLSDGETVEVLAEGEREKLRALIASLRVGPPGAQVRGVATRWLGYSGRYNRFIIKQ